MKFEKLKIAAAALGILGGAGAMEAPHAVAQTTESVPESAVSILKRYAISDPIVMHDSGTKVFSTSHLQYLGKDQILLDAKNSNAAVSSFIVNKDESMHVREYQAKIDESTTPVLQILIKSKDGELRYYNFKTK